MRVTFDQIDPRTEDVARALRLKVGQGLVGAAVAEGRPLVVNNVHADPRYVEAVPGSQAELVVPLLKDSALGNADLNGAVRVTDYSTSGTVATWKAGLTYEPIPDIKFRVVRSRDIRAPNLQELYAAGASQAVDVTDPLATVNPTRITQITDGNPALKPEVTNSFETGLYREWLGSRIRTDVVYFRTKSEHQPVPLWWQEGRIVAKLPGPATITKLQSLAERLAANLYDDDGERLWPIGSVMHPWNRSRDVRSPGSFARRRSRRKPATLRPIVPGEVR